MEELVKKYSEGGELNNSLFFDIDDFESTRLTMLPFDTQSIMEILIKFEQMTGLIKINNGTVAFTGKGLLEAQKRLHDWC